MSSNPAVSAALQAAAARGDTDALRGYYQQNGGTWQGRTAAQDGGNGGGNDVENSVMQAVQRRLASGDPMGRSLTAALQTITSSKRDYAAKMAEIGEQHYGHNVTAAGNQARLGLDRSRLMYEMGQTGAKKFDDDNMKSTFANEKDEKTGQFAPSQGRANALGQFLKANAKQWKGADGKPVDLESLSQSSPSDYSQLRSSAESQFGLGSKVNEYAGSTLFGQQSGWAGPKITDVRDMDLGDFTKGSSLADAALAGFKAGNYRKGVVLDVGGRKQVMPFGALMNDPNGGQYRAMINQWLQSKGRKQLGDNWTGE
jgi:hypothetical protein